MLNHLIRTAKSDLGNATQCRGSGGGPSGGFIMFIHKENMSGTISVSAAHNVTNSLLTEAMSACV